MARRATTSRRIGQEEAVIARRFWAISGGAGTLKAGQWVLRPDDERARSIDSHYHFKRCLPLDDWPREPPIFRYEKVGPAAPDVQWTFGYDYMIVSGRLRSCLEANAPGHAAFLAVGVVGPERERLHADYWAVVWQHTVHAVVGSPLELDPARIPLGMRVALAPFDESRIGGLVIVDNELKRKLAAERFVGLRFNALRIDRGPDDRISSTDPRTGARVMIARKLIPSDRYFDPAAYADAFPARDAAIAGEADPLQSYLYWHSAFSTLREEHVRTLLDAGYRPRGESAENKTPWQVTLNPRSRALIELLSEHGATWNVANVLGITPLMAAAVELDVEAIEALLSRGARISDRDHSGATAWDHFLRAAEFDSVDPAEFDRARRLLVREP